MKRSKKITAMLIVAMVMTATMVVMVYAADYASKPAWNTGTGRYTQLYTLSTGVNWSYTTDVTGAEDYVVTKMYPERDALVQCTANGLTAFPSYYQVRRTNGDGELLASETAYTGTGIIYISYSNPVSPGTGTCLGIRNDPRYSTTVTNEGSWSPDRY